MFSRVYNTWILLRHTRVFQFLIGSDKNLNYECLYDFLLQETEKS
jgi:hypothetical protein